jgi:hypothetical protein
MKHFLHFTSPHTDWHALYAVIQQTWIRIPDPHSSVNDEAQDQSYHQSFFASFLCVHGTIHGDNKSNFRP